MTTSGTILLALFAVSGACGLVYEVVWIRWLGLVTGNFSTATATVVAVFMGGMALGYWAVGRRAGALSPRRALALYAALEAAIAVLGALSPLLFRTSSPLYLALATSFSLPIARAVVAGLFLLPPAFLMGGTLPAILPAAGGGRLAGLYAANTAGAAAGPLLAAFVLMPRAGMTLAVLAAAGLNAAVAIAAFILSRRLPAGAGDDRSSAVPASPVPPWWAATLAAGCGLLALAWEVTLARLVILIVTGVSVYGLAVTLSSFLAGMAAGAWAAGAWAAGAWTAGGALRRFRLPASVTAGPAAVGLALLLPWAFSLALPLWDRIPPLLYRFWSGNPPLLLWQAVNCAVAFVLTLSVAGAFGFALPALVTAASRPRSREVGRLFGANALGAVVGAPLAGFVLMPLLGLDRTVSLLGGLSLAAAALAIAAALPRHRLPVAFAALFAIPLPFLVPAPDRRIENAGMHMRTFRFAGMEIMDAMEQAGSIVFQEDGPTARVAVRRGPNARVLVINGKSDSGTSLTDMLTMTLAAHIAVLTRGSSGDCLVIGLGAGITAGSLLRYPVRSVTAVEIEPAVYRAARMFSDVNHDALNDPRMSVVLDDARHRLLADSRTYDVIVSEPTNLYVSGMASLFTAEFYRLARSRLAPGGVFCQWVHYYEVNAEDCRMAARTFASVFPNATLWYLTGGDFFLVGSDFLQVLDLGRIRAIYMDWRIADDLKRIGIGTPEAFASRMLMGSPDLAAFAGSGRLTTDDLPVPEFTTPYRMNDLQSPTINRDLLQGHPAESPLPLARESADDRVALAERYEADGALRRSLAEYRQAARLRPSYGTAWWGIAHIMQFLKDDEGARGAVSRGLAKSPGYAPLIALVGELGRGRERDPFTDAGAPSGGAQEGGAPKADGAAGKEARGEGH